MADEVSRVQIAAAEAGVQLFIGEDRSLKARPRAKVTPELAARISAVKGALLGELFVAESLAWEQETYSTADRARLNAAAAPDQRAKWKFLLDFAISAAIRGDAGMAADAMEKYRLITLCVAESAGLPVNRFPDNPPEYPRKQE